MAKHNVRIPAALWDEWQSKLRPEEWCLLIPGMLATPASDQIGGPGALNGLVGAKRISEHCYGAPRTYRLRAEAAA